MRTLELEINAMSILVCIFFFCSFVHSTWIGRLPEGRKGVGMQSKDPKAVRLCRNSEWGRAAFVESVLPTLPGKGILLLKKFLYQRLQSDNLSPLAPQTGPAVPAVGLCRMSEAIRLCRETVGLCRRQSDCVGGNQIVSRDSRIVSEAVGLCREAVSLRRLRSLQVIHFLLNVLWVWFCSIHDQKFACRSGHKSCLDEAHLKFLTRLLTERQQQGAFNKASSRSCWQPRSLQSGRTNEQRDLYFKRIVLDRVVMFLVVTSCFNEQSYKHEDKFCLRSVLSQRWMLVFVFICHSPRFCPLILFLFSFVLFICLFNSPALPQCRWGAIHRSAIRVEICRRRHQYGAWRCPSHDFRHARRPDRYGAVQVLQNRWKRQRCQFRVSRGAEEPVCVGNVDARNVEQFENFSIFENAKKMPVYTSDLRLQPGHCNYRATITLRISLV